MQINSKIQIWLKDQIEAGRFGDETEALEAIIAHYQATVIEGRQDDDWVKPLLDRAKKSLDSGKGRPAQEVHDRLREELDL